MKSLQAFFTGILLLVLPLKILSLAFHFTFLAKKAETPPPRLIRDYALSVSTLLPYIYCA